MVLTSRRLVDNSGRVSPNHNCRNALRATRTWWSSHKPRISTINDWRSGDHLTGTSLKRETCRCLKRDAEAFEQQVSGCSLKVWMGTKRSDFPVPTNHFLAVIRIPFLADRIVAYHGEACWKRWTFGGFVRSAERNPVPDKRIVFLMVCVPTGHNPVIAFNHGRILSERKVPSSIAIVISSRSLTRIASTPVKARDRASQAGCCLGFGHPRWRALRK